MTFKLPKRDAGLVIGSSGEIGSIICKYLEIKKKEYIKTFFSNKKNGLHLNLESKSSIDSFLKKLENSKLEIVIFNASITPKSYSKEDYADFQILNKIFAVNAASLIYFVENLERSNIAVKNFLIISSEGALNPTNKHIAYNASKASQLNIYASFKEKFKDIQWYIMYLSKTVENNYSNIISLELDKILKQEASPSREIYFSKRGRYKGQLISLVKGIFK